MDIKASWSRKRINYSAVSKDNRHEIISDSKIISRKKKIYVKAMFERENGEHYEDIKLFLWAILWEGGGSFCGTKTVDNSFSFPRKRNNKVLCLRRSAIHHLLLRTFFSCLKKWKLKLCTTLKWLHFLNFNLFNQREFNQTHFIQHFTISAFQVIHLTWI